MENNKELVDQIQRDITGEFFRIVGLAPDGIFRKLVGPILYRPTRHFAELAAQYDQLVLEMGITAASLQYLERFTLGWKESGASLVPRQGSLVLVSNHPGTFDLFTVLANLPRKDIKVIISGVPVVRSLPEVAKHLIYVPSDPHGRIPVIRSAIRHLKQGGCLVLFPTGILDPDPQIMPGAEAALGKWSRSLEIFFRHVADVHLQIAIVSGVLEPGALKNPLTMLVRERWKKQRLAEFLLVAGKMLSGEIFEVEPKISFTPPKTITEIEPESASSPLMEAVITLARDQLTCHLEQFPGKNRGQ